MTQEIRYMEDSRVQDIDEAEAVILKMLERQKGTKDVIERGDSAVQQFYRGACVFLTGGSGFLGKQLIEKLFRSCKPYRIYMLLRAKKGKSVEERLAEILKDPLYDTLREDKPDFAAKIVPIVGELAEKDLGISSKDREVLIKEVDVMFHVAATISFVEPLRSATLVNVRGTRDLLVLAKQCKKLRALVYMSTAYSYGTFSRRDTAVMEQFYPSPLPPDVMIAMAETIDEQRLNNIKDGLIRDWPNTYSFTKAVAEELVRSSSTDLPICIIRPSIVMCARREPYPGWIDLSSVFGPSGIALGSIMGVIHSLQSVDSIRVDFIPVDYVNNTAIVAATTASKQITIYHITSSNRNHITMGDLIYILHHVTWGTVVSPAAIWYCFCLQSPYRWVHQLRSFLLHTIPAHLADGACVLSRKKPRFKKIYATISKLSGTLDFYVNNNWIFNDKNTVDMYNNLSQSDKLIYHFDVTDIDWTEQITLWCVGLRKYIIRDGLKSTREGVRRQYYYLTATYLLSTLLVFVSFWFLYYLFVYLNNVFLFF